VVKLVDTTDLKSVARVKPAYRFDSGSGHHYLIQAYQATRTLRSSRKTQEGAP
jgi:hypothetical protein